jgi:hypothetical protein
MRTYLQKARVKKPPKALRATAASNLAEHPSYKFCVQYYLGHPPRTVADKHYVRPTDTEFFEALLWLEEALGLRVALLKAWLVVARFIGPCSARPDESGHYEQSLGRFSTEQNSL